VSTTCARCGLPLFDINVVSVAGQCWGEDNGLGTIACRDRELANLRSLLRSVTGKLEDARERCNELDWNDMSVAQVAARIDSVLEALL